MRRIGLVMAVLAMLALPAFLVACGGGGETATKAKQDTDTQEPAAQDDAGTAYSDADETTGDMEQPAGTMTEAEADTSGEGEEDAGGSPDDHR